MQSILEIASSADSLATFLSAAIIALLAVGKVVVHFWSKHKEKKASLINEIEDKNDDDDGYSSHEALESLEVISETYVEIIKNLRQEVERLKADVQDLYILRTQHEADKKKVEELLIKNQELEQIVEEQAVKISRLQRRLAKTK